MNDRDFKKGAQLYAEGRYWEAHEAWEKAWRGSEDEQTRLLLQGLIQTCAALYKVYEKKDVASAARLFQRAVHKLEQLPDTFQNVQIAPFIASATECHDILKRDKDQGTLDRARIPRLVLLTALCAFFLLALVGCTSCSGSDASANSGPTALSSSPRMLPGATSATGVANGAGAMDGAPTADATSHEIHEDGRAYTPQAFPFPVASTEVFIEDMKMGRDLGEVLGRTGGSVAINGGFFDTDERPLGLGLSHAKVLSTFKKTMSGGVLLLDQSHATLFPTETFDPDAQSDARFAVQCKPRLVVDGKVNIKRDDGKRSARTALCVKDAGKTLVAVLVRDATDPSFGPSLFALATYLAADGCEAALNLDGGPSTGAAWRDASGVHAERPTAGIRHAIVFKAR